MDARPDTSLSAARGAFLDAVLDHALAAMRPGWSVLCDRALSGDGADPPARIRYALLHPKAGIALLDVLPDAVIPDAADRLRRMLGAAGFASAFGGYPPIVHLHLPVRALPRLGRLLDEGFARQPPLALRGGAAWIGLAQQALAGQTLRPPPRQGRHRNSGWNPLRMAPHRRRLAWLWGSVTAFLRSVRLPPSPCPPERSAVGAAGGSAAAGPGHAPDPCAMSPEAMPASAPEGGTDGIAGSGAARSGRGPALPRHPDQGAVRGGTARFRSVAPARRMPGGH